MKTLSAALVAAMALLLALATPAYAYHPPVPGEPCGPSLHLHHAVGIDGIDVICRGPYHHKFRWVVYIAPPPVCKPPHYDACPGGNG